jgi:hypothetical protein
MAERTALSTRCYVICVQLRQELDDLSEPVGIDNSPSGRFIGLPEPEQR